MGVSFHDLRHILPSAHLGDGDDIDALVEHRRRKAMAAAMKRQMLDAGPLNDVVPNRAGAIAAFVFEDAIIGTAIARDICQSSYDTRRQMRESLVMYFRLPNERRRLV